MSAARCFAIASFFILDEHQLALVKLDAPQIARFQMLRTQLQRLRNADAGVESIAVTAAPVLWLPYDSELQERMSEEIGLLEYEVKSAARGEDSEEPESSLVHVTEQGLHFSSVWETDAAQTATLPWALLEVAS